jgi:SAM-dependent methyltransferase
MIDSIATAPSVMTHRQTNCAMSLEFVRRTFEKLGREDPLYGVLTDPTRRHNRWDRTEFFATGVSEIADVIEHAERRGLKVERTSALDFGCGVGRLSQALAAHFEKVVGIDIAAAMIARANEFNRFGDRVQYVVNVADDLALFETGRFDFVYSNITLQHIPPDSSANYIREFFRVLKPGGAAVFQVHSGRAYRPRSLRALLYTVRRRYLRRASKIARGKAPYEMHYLPLEQVNALVAESGGRLVDIVSLGTGERARTGANFRYFATKVHHSA